MARAEWGLGFYSATPAIMRALRSRIEADPDRALKAVKSAQKAGFALGGRPYARPRSAEDTPELLRPFYDCKSVDLSRCEAPHFVADQDLPERLLKGFQALTPMYQLLMEAVEEAIGIREV